LYSAPNIIRVMKSRKMRWAEHVAHLGETKNAYKIFIVQPKGKRSVGRPKHRLYNEIFGYIKGR